MSFTKNNPSMIFSTMDGLWELRKVITLFYYTIFIDVMFILLTKKGVFYFSEENKPDFNLGNIIGVILSFGFFSSLLLVIISLLFFNILIDIKYKYLSTKNPQCNSKEEYGFVSLSILENEALDKQSKFIYNIYNEAKSRIKKRESEHLRLEYVSVGTFVLLIAEWYLSSSDGITSSFLNWVWSILNIYGYEITHNNISLGFIITSLIYTITVCLPRETNNKIYYPSLYIAKKKQDEARESRDREIEIEILKNMRN